MPIGADAHAVASYPEDDDTWRVKFKNESDMSLNFVVEIQVTCASIPD